MKNIRELRGQKIASRLLDAYLKSAVPPLLILHGPEGTGKWSAAEAFIQQKLCSAGTGCGTCPNCRKILAGEHPDFIQFPEDRIAIGEPQDPQPFTIRWLLKTRIMYSPFDGDMRFVLFPRADLIQNEAETALLKTLEEPPPHTRFIFLVHSLDDLKATVVSRGVCVPFGRLPLDMLREFQGVRPEHAEMLGGSLHLLPFFYTPLHKAMLEKIESGLNHPLAMRELEKWLIGGERKRFADLQGDEDYTYGEIVEIFTLMLLRAFDEMEKKEQEVPVSSGGPSLGQPASPGHWTAMRKAVFEFKADYRKDMSGLQPYLLSRLFHRLAMNQFSSNR